MRTTLDISDELFRQTKRRAADEGTTFRSIVEAALRSYLAGQKPSSDYRLAWPTRRGTIQPGVDLSDRDALFDLMDGRS